MADVPAAGIQSGQGGTFLDSGKPLAGIVHDTLRRDLPRARTPASFIVTGDSSSPEILGHLPQPNHQVGGIPRPGGKFQQVCIPGYSGHIAGKAAENVHGMTFGVANERATQMLPLRHMRRVASAPVQISAPGAASSRGFSVAPRVPGYAGTIPGKHAETVHALRFAEASEQAKKLREHNPHVTSDGWLRRGQWPGDRMATYSWNNRFQRLDLQELFTPEQERLAAESNRQLGQTFGLKPSKPNQYKPGDRFLHAMYKQEKTKRLDPSKVPAAGMPTHSEQLDQLRYRMHFALARHG